MTGLRVSIYRDGYDSPLNRFYGKREVTVISAGGPFEPTDDAPAAIIVAGPGSGYPIIVPANVPDADRLVGPMFGGTYAATSDSRLRVACKAITGKDFYGALAVHDRYETPAQYEMFS